MLSIQAVLNLFFFPLFKNCLFTKVTLKIGITPGSVCSLFSFFAKFLYCLQKSPFDFCPSFCFSDILHIFTGLYIFILSLLFLFLDLDSSFYLQGAFSSVLEVLVLWIFPASLLLPSCLFVPFCMFLGAMKYCGVLAVNWQQGWLVALVKKLSVYMCVHSHTLRKKKTPFLCFALFVRSSLRYLFFSSSLKSLDNTLNACWVLNTFFFYFYS